MLALHVALHRLLKLHDLFRIHVIQITLVHGEEAYGHLCHRHRGILFLFHEFGRTFATLELLARRLVEIRSKLGERRKFAVLCERQTNTTAQLFDQGALRCTTHS